MTATSVALLQTEELNLLLDTFKDTGSHCDGYLSEDVRYRFGKLVVLRLLERLILLKVDGGTRQTQLTRLGMRWLCKYR